MRAEKLHNIRQRPPALCGVTEDLRMDRAICAPAHLLRIGDVGLRDLLGVFARIGTTHHGMNGRCGSGHSRGWRRV